ncbi:hypothetical protein [Pseudonocardia sp. TRM90224]|uniref:hypothetical protein n=1 Tax=Pseudonocardia sp. TRM90224 TaxID=2812678 RepID=UPI001E4DB1D5|nr:hypothetical protein [Pseudonocardia sp. TRM90224]
MQDGAVQEIPDRLRRRLDEVFGDVLPTTTRDEQDDPTPQDVDRDDADLLADRPPHHDRER